MDGENGLKETTPVIASSELNVNVFTAPGKTMAGVVRLKQLVVARRPSALVLVVQRARC